MALFEALYGRRCRSPIIWFKVGKATLIGPDLVHEGMEKVWLIRERLKTAQGCQKSYVDVKRKELEFAISDLIYVNILPMKRKKRFGKNGKLSACYFGPYKIMGRFGNVAYELDFPRDLASMQLVFHVSLLKKCIGVPASVVPLESVVVEDSVSYEEVLVEILDRQFRKLRNKEIVLVKILRQNQSVEGAT
ncbi:uncharacterized protein LOC124890670 [Capsicum annuum]|uniref:uncharacterized protein LOC124890670 n=1 Tax=Capsicum annuum TaxID=4072 RepID=UPI0007BF2C18|nr:uncharacterized protein LOC124890670 [Capsicum annuum]